MDRINIVKMICGTLMAAGIYIPAAALAGLLFLNEHLSVMQWAAIAAIMTASIGAVLTTTQAARAASNANPKDQPLL